MWKVNVPLACLLILSGCSKPFGDEEKMKTDSPDKEFLWNEVDSFPGLARRNPVTFTIGGKGYLGLGWNGTNKSSFCKDLWCYDTLSGSWSRRSGLKVPDPVHTPCMAACTVDNKAYLWYSETQKIYIYDPGKNGWDSVAPGITREKRDVWTAFSANHKAYFLYAFSKVVWEYDPAKNTLTQKNDIPFIGNGIYSATFHAFEYGGNGYIIFGKQYSTEIYKYDHLTDSWEWSATLAKIIDVPSFICRGDSGIYIGEGTTFIVSDFSDTCTVLGHSLSRGVWCFTPGDQFLRKASPFAGTIRSGTGYFSIGNAGYIVGGVTVDEKNKFRYLSDSWSCGR